MARKKQYVFSARTTEQGLKALGEVKAKLGLNWDELVIEAVSAHYNIDKAMMTLPKKEAPAQQESPVETPTEATTPEQPAATEQETPSEEKRPAKKQKKGGKKAEANR
jgi:hypothetical protein